MTLSVTAALGWTRRASRSWPSATAEPSTVCIWCRSAAIGRSQHVWNVTSRHWAAGPRADLLPGLFLRLAAAADVGGVGAPVSAGYLLPLDRGLDVDAGCLGQDGGWDVSGQGEQGGAAALPRADAEGAEPLGERVFGQRASWPASREQPGGRDAEQAAARCLAAGRERADEGVQRGGQHDGPAAQAKERAAVLVQDMLGRQGRDDVELLGVEEDQEPGDPVGGPGRRRRGEAGVRRPVQREAGAVRRDT